MRNSTINIPNVIIFDQKWVGENNPKLGDHIILHWQMMVRKFMNDETTNPQATSKICRYSVIVTSISMWHLKVLQELINRFNMKTCFACQTILNSCMSHRKLRFVMYSENSKRHKQRSTPTTACKKELPHEITFECVRNGASQNYHVIYVCTTNDSDGNPLELEVSP